MNKILFIAIAILFSISAKSQFFPIWGPDSPVDFKIGYEWEYSGNDYIKWYADTVTAHSYWEAYSFKNLDENHTVTLPNDVFVTADEDGYIFAVEKEDITWPWENITGEPAFLTSEVDGSTTNELELPSQTGNSGKYLGTNGSTVSWTPVPNPITYYNQSGTVSAPTKKISFDVSPNTGNGYSIDISAAGLSSIYSYSVVPVKNTSTATSCPKVSVKSISTSAIVVNIIEGNGILQLGLLLGVSEQFANTSGITIHVEVEGN